MVKEVGRESIPYVDFGTRGGAKTQESKSLKENDWLTEDSHTEGQVGHGSFPTLIPQSLTGMVFIHLRVELKNQCPLETESFSFF